MRGDLGTLLGPDCIGMSVLGVTRAYVQQSNTRLQQVEHTNMLVALSRSAVSIPSKRNNLKTSHYHSYNAKTILSIIKS